MGEDKSHMVRHQRVAHPGEHPEFIFKVVGHHRTALHRQIHEAARIRRRGGEASILNSKGEFSRCRIPRMIVEEEDEECVKRDKEREQKRIADMTDYMKNEEETWNAKKTRELVIGEVKRRRPSDMEMEEGQGGRRKRLKKLHSEIYLKPQERK